MLIIRETDVRYCILCREKKGPKSTMALIRDDNNITDDYVVFCGRHMRFLPAEIIKFLERARRLRDDYDSRPHKASS